MEPGQILAGRYELIEPIGEGGMGQVWRGKQTALGRAVAIKIIHRDQDAPELRARFAREAELAAKVDHRNVVDIIEYGATDDGDQYLVMPLLKGEVLSARLAREPAPTLGDVLGWTRSILGGLAAIHDAGIVHRDLKPGNVFLAEDADGVVPKLLDFGISRSSDPQRSGLTGLGTAIGTPKYMAPEQFESASNVDQRADLYSVGVMLYEALAGDAPFDDDDAFAVYRRILKSEPIPLTERRPDVPKEIVDLIHRALAKDPAERFAHARQMRDAIDAIAASGALGAQIEATLARTGTQSPLENLAMASTTPAPLAIAATIPLVQKQKETLPGGSSPTPPPPRAPRTASEGGAASTHALDTSEKESALASARPPAPESKAWIYVLVGLFVVLGGGGIVWAVMSSSDDRRVPEVGGTGAPPGTENATDAHRVAGPDRLDLLALAWARLEAAERQSEVRIVPSGGRWAIVTAPTVTPEEASRLATALGGTSEAARWEPERGLQPALAMTTVRLALHTDSNMGSTTLRVSPPSAMVVALLGSIDGAASAMEGSDAVAYVVMSANEAGWMRSRFVRAHDGCLPDATTFVSATQGDEEAVRADTIVSRTRMDLAGSRRNVFVLAARDRRSSVSFLGVYRADIGCQLGEQIALTRIDGVLDEFFYTDSAPAGGQTFLVASSFTGTTPPTDGMMNWSAYEPGTASPVWTDRVPTAPFLTRRRAGSVNGSRDRIVRTQRDRGYVLTVQRPEQERVWFTLEDGAFVEAHPTGTTSPPTGTEGEESQGEGTQPPPPEAPAP